MIAAEERRGLRPRRETRSSNRTPSSISRNDYDNRKAAAGQHRLLVDKVRALRFVGQQTSSLPTAIPALDHLEQI